MATAASFDTVDLFGTGPHRFLEGPRGEHVVPRAVIDAFDPSSVPAGELELIVRVEGTLFAASDLLLDEQIEVIMNTLDHPPRIGTLADGLGHEWSDMSFTRFERTEPARRGRLVTQAYRMDFRRFTI